MEFCSKQWTMRISGSDKSILMPAMMGQFGSSIDCNVRLVLLFSSIFLTQTLMYSCAGNCFCAVFDCFENESEWREFQQQQTPIQNNFTQARCPHTWYLSQTPQTASVEKKLVMWRNSPHDMLSNGNFLHMINVGKLCHMGKFLHITNVGKICQVENFSTWERWRKSVMWRNFSSWEMWRK